MAMRLSCLPVSFFRDLQEGRMSIAAWAEMGARAGLDAIDLSIAFVPDRSASAVAALRRDIAAAGMSVAMLTTYPDFTHPDPACRERELSLAEETVRVAAGLGARLLRVTAGQAHPETGRDEGISWAVEGLTRLVERTAGTGVTLAYENHARPFVWDYTDFSQPPEVFAEIVRRTARAGLKVNYDTANATAFADDPLALLDLVIDRVVSVHAADTGVRGALKMVLLGTGLVDFPAVFRRLKRAGFDGWICMEEGSFQGEEGVRAAARYIRETWEAA
ncbi:MAG: sugar phosphate isomerase/epimerase family protein [Anaerolineae bacterium]|nr:sugar phosphate isomerase/epimerase family protein [Anaerolineae bacterium]